MRVTRVETVKWAALREFSRPFIFVQVHTDEGLVGLGQTADLRTEAVVHDFGRRFLLGADPLQVELLWSEMFEDASAHGYAGAEMRAISAIDIALWDLLGQTAGLPIYALLGGLCRERIRIYNTCSASLKRSEGNEAREDPVTLAEELMSEGITCMKWGMFGEHARDTRGRSISDQVLKEGVAAVEAIATRFNGEMEVMVDSHGTWNLVSAKRIARALESLPVHWLEDMVWQEDVEDWHDLRASTSLAIAGSERLLGRRQMRRLLEAGGTDVMIGDVTWTGGISEVKKMATMAEAYGTSFAGHDHSGPVNLWASAHISLNVPNAYIMESSRVFYDPRFGYYHEVVEGEPIARNGFLYPPEGPGLGIRLRPDFLARRDVEVVASEP